MYDHKFILIRIISEENAELRCWTNSVHLQQTAAINTKGRANPGVQKSKSAATVKAMNPRVMWPEPTGNRIRSAGICGCTCRLVTQTKGKQRLFSPPDPSWHSHIQLLSTSALLPPSSSQVYFFMTSQLFFWTRVRLQASGQTNSSSCWGDARTNESCAHTQKKEKSVRKCLKLDK